MNATEYEIAGFSGGKAMRHENAKLTEAGQATCNERYEEFENNGKTVYTQSIGVSQKKENKKDEELGAHPTTFPRSVGEHRPVLSCIFGYTRAEVPFNGFERSDIGFFACGIAVFTFSVFSPSLSGPT